MLQVTEFLLSSLEQPRGGSSASLEALGLCAGRNVGKEGWGAGTAPGVSSLPTFIAQPGLCAWITRLLPAWKRSRPLIPAALIEGHFISRQQQELPLQSPSRCPASFAANQADH